jgi:hypothetical protein
VEHAGRRGHRYVSFEPGTNRMILTVDACGATCSSNPLESRASIYNNPVPAGVVAPTPSGRVPLMFNQAGSRPSTPPGAWR